MTGPNDQSSGGKTADEAPKNDYVITGEESEMEKALKPADADKAGKAEKKPSKDAEPADDDEDDGDDDEDQDEGGKPKRKRGGFQKKIARLEDEKEYWRSKALGGSDKKPSDDGKGDDKSKADAKKDARPDPKDFDDYDDYNEALTDWKVDQKLAKRDEDRQTEAKKSEFKKSQESKIERYTKGIDAAKEIYDDFDEVIEEYDGPLTIGMQQALVDSDIGPQVAYYLAKHPKEAEKIGAMRSIIEINKAIGKIEAKLEAQNDQDDKAADDEKPKVSKSPPPINPVKGSSKNKKDPDDLSYEEYMQERKKRRGY
jgi:hypothetical protein